MIFRALRTGLWLLLLLWCGCQGGCAQRSEAPDGLPSTQLIALSGLSSFTRAASSNHVVFLSPVIRTDIALTELIPSWNTEFPGCLIVEVQAVYPDRQTRFYNLGRWSANRTLHPRESVLNQKDEDGDVATDTLRLKRPTHALRVRLTFGGSSVAEPSLKLLALSCIDTTRSHGQRAADRSVWGKTLEVPERSQMAYPNGGVLCSPTTVSMILSYWAHRLEEPSLNKDVPEVQEGVYDANWEGTGNWSFNMAYAGALPGMAAYVVRLRDVAELEQLVGAGIPVGLSICYNRLRGKTREPSGHLVVCVGFTAEGDPVINDPGTTRNVRKVFPRANLIDAWAYSKNASYVIHPQGFAVPKIGL